MSNESELNINEAKLKVSKEILDQKLEQNNENTRSKRSRNEDVTKNLIYRLNQMILNFDQYNYNEFKELISDYSFVHSSPLVDYLAFQLNDLFALNSGDYSNDVELVEFQIAALKTRILKENIEPKISIDLIIKHLTNHKSISCTKTHLDMIKIIKLVIKKGFIKNLEPIRLEKFSSIVEDYLLDKFKKEISSFNFSHANLYTINKIIKCSLIYINETEKLSNCSRFSDSFLIYFVEINIQDENKFKNNLCIYAILITYMVRLVMFSYPRSEKITRPPNKNNICVLDDLNIDLIFNNLDDDQLIEFNLMCLEKEVILEKNENFYSCLFDFKLNSHVLFVKLMASISFDYQIVLDWLIENQTKFLIYFVKYLKYLIRELDNARCLSHLNKLFSIENQYQFSKFELSLKNRVKRYNIKDYPNKSLELFTKLTIKIRRLKNHFGYNIKPMINLLERLIQFKPNSLK